MKCTIIITMDALCGFKFFWAEKNSLIQHMGEVIKPENRTEKSGVCRLDASRMWEDKEDKKHYESRVLVPAWIKRAVDWAFVTNEARLVPGLKFEVECNACGLKPVVSGIPEKTVDTSWMNALPNTKKSAPTAPTAPSKDDAGDMLKK